MSSGQQRIWLILLLQELLHHCITADRSVFCAYESRLSLYERFSVSDIDGNLCDHLLFTYVGLSPGGALVVGENRHLDPVSGSFAELRRLKAAHPHLRTLLVVGGHKVSDEKWIRVAGDRRLREGLALSATEFARHNGFDGVVLAWIDPTHRTHLSQLLKAMSDRLGASGMKSGLLIASPHEEDLYRGYNFKDISQMVDYLLILAFDYHGPWEKIVRHFSPMTKVERSVRIVLREGMVVSKVVLGIGTFGRSYTLAHAANHQLGAQSIGPGLAGKTFRQKGFLGFNEICNEVLLNSPVVQEATSRSFEGPYTYRDDQWVGYEDVQSVHRKVRYARETGLGGVVLWTLASDDVANKCAAGAYPLHVAANRAMKKRNISWDISHFL